MALKKELISSSKYGIKCPYAMAPKGICIHNTGNDATARNEANYMKSNDLEVSYHIVIDDIEAIQVVPFNRNTWHSGDGATGEGNRNYISVEICYSKSGGTKFDNAEVRASKEVALLMKEYGFTIANIKRHYDFSRKNCPQRTMEKGWTRFLNMIQKELDALNKGEVDMKGIVLYYGDVDIFSAVLVSQKKGYPLMKYSDFIRSGLKAEVVIQIGGRAEDKDRYTTMKNATKYL